MDGKRRLENVERLFSSWTTECHDLTQKEFKNFNADFLREEMFSILYMISCAARSTTIQRCVADLLRKLKEIQLGFEYRGVK